MEQLRKIIGKPIFKLCIIIILQVFGVFALVNFASHRTVVYNIAIVINFCIGISLLSKDDLNPIYKVMWIMILAMLPVIGVVIYLLWGDRKITKRKARQIDVSIEKSREAILRFGKSIDPDEQLSGGEKASAKYLQNYAGAPVYKNTEVEYFASGEDFFAVFLDELEKAERFIFLEYFIIKAGEMWNKTFDVLKRKAKAGVDIRLVYDAIGSIFDLPDDFISTLTKEGIKCHKFNPIKFSWMLTDYTFLNHRDHRKICIIDGNVGFTGGINIADEYINLKKPFGYWKDSAVRLKGDAVYSFTNTFLKMWEYVSGDTSCDYNIYIPTLSPETDFFVQPYEDTPTDIENVSENSYFNVIYHARKYVYITTPYLIIDNEMITALSLAAKSGVDVKIIVPGIPDKKYVYYLTQSYYPELIKAGVEIYEYTPGFMHSKIFIRDDEQAIVGSANMDYRSLYLHFENCCAFYGGPAINKVKADFEKTLQCSRMVTVEDIKKVPKIKRIVQLLLKFFAPVL